MHRYTFPYQDDVISIDGESGNQGRDDPFFYNEFCKSTSSPSGCVLDLTFPYSAGELSLTFPKGGSKVPGGILADGAASMFFPDLLQSTYAISSGRNGSWQDHYDSGLNPHQLHVPRGTVQGALKIVACSQRGLVFRRSAGTRQ